MYTDTIGSQNSGRFRLLQSMHLDPPLVFALLLLTACGLGILYSAGGQNIDLIIRQSTRLALAFGVMLLMAQIPPQNFKLWAPWIFLLGVTLLAFVLILGDIGKGAQRWLDFGFVRFQPSEMMKLATPMVVAWYLADKALPPSFKHLLIAFVLVIIPTMLIAKQPDLGTSLLIAAAGFFIIYFASLKWRFIAGFTLLTGALTPVVWHYMHAYQRQRVLTFLNPESDPLGAGYHIIQSKIAIGSGGLYGKGWLNGTQSHLDFLPERSTDFIFSVFAEEFGFMGVILLLAIYFFIVIRGLVIASSAQDSFGRLLAGSLSMTFLVYLFVNVGMVSGLLPVVGVPLPLVSYGGTSMVTLMAGFGMLMSINSHRRLLRK
ncbi:MAG: rod shape-determining protein RodA [Gammaproteobacteria bacterium]|nr:rod shape-determining protein RodA [Gammaproteobacteria bacterium]